MQLVINNYGAYLRKRKDCFLVMLDERDVEIPIVKVDSIWVSTSALISTDAVHSAMENNIDMVFLDKYGDPYARIWHPKIGSTTLIRRRQLEASESEEGISLVKEWCSAKMRNQVALLRKLRKTRPEAQELSSAIDIIVTYRKKLGELHGSIEENRQSILGIEGGASRTYFDALSLVMPEQFAFNGRSRRPARDQFNCALNYGYGVLYGVVERACILAGLDPYVGILHTDDYNKKSFVFDVIEPYRGIVDETVVFLFTTRRFKESCFDEIDGGYTLNAEGKKTLITELNAKLDEARQHRRKKMRRRNIILAEMHGTAKKLTKGW
jgi:CRISPR-associated protein Cas1